MNALTRLYRNVFHPSRKHHLRKGSAGEYRDKQNLNSGYIIIIYLLIKSVRIKPYFIERKNRFIFENEITFDVSPLNTAKI